MGDRETDGFLVCGVHGDIYWQPGARNGDAIEAHALQAVHPDAPSPKSGSPLVCPFCAVPMWRYLRPSVRRR